MDENNSIQLFEDRKYAPHGTKNKKNGISLLWMLLLS